MAVALLPYPPHVLRYSTPFHDSSTILFIRKNPKFLNCQSSNPTPFPLQNHSFPSTTNINNSNNNEKSKNNNNNNDEASTSSNNGGIKMPTAPWMKGPLFLQPDEVLDFSKPTHKKRTQISDTQQVDRSLTERISGRRGKKAVKKIVERIEKLQGGNNLVDTHKNWDDTHKNWGDFEGGFLMGKLEGVVNGDGSKKFRRKLPWESEKEMVFRRVKREKVEKGVELVLDKDVLERLRREASKMRKWVKVKKAGVTQAVVDEVHSIWANNELVMLQFDFPLCRNMDRAREIVEIKTGGLVVWSKKDKLVAYRGCDYQQRKRKRFRKSNFELDHSGQRAAFVSDDQRSLYEREGDRLLDGLGPRFIDWWYPKPLPVDGDLLPEVVPGFKPPFRLCPPDVRPKLTDDELTYLRTCARSLPVHFVLGRNSKLQGLAVAILQLWERCIIAKIAIKWGVPNTNNELMASELKHLTGGVLLLRNKFFIILYRGKDFLPGNVAHMVIEREMELNNWQLHEEDARFKAIRTLNVDAETPTGSNVVGTLSEFQHTQTISGKLSHFSSEAEAKLEAEKERLQTELRKQEHKLAILKFKIEKAEKELLKLNLAWKPSEEESDQELMTEEERECFRKIGLKMDRVLVLGRRGVFDGVIEGLHQHWKHRELAKVITMQKAFVQVVYTARLLERESGGILVSIDRLKKGHAILIYRGKNYKRPIELGDNLLDKRKALKRSLEMQRVGSLKFFAYQRQKEIADLKLKLDDLEKQSKISD